MRQFPPHANDFKFPLEPGVSKKSERGNPGTQRAALQQQDVLPWNSHSISKQPPASRGCGAGILCLEDTRSITGVFGASPAAAHTRGAVLQRPGSWRQPRAGAQQGTRVMEERARGRYGCSLSTREREGPASPSLVWWNVPEPGNSGYHFRSRLKSLHKEPIFVPQRQR